MQVEIDVPKMQLESGDLENIIKNLWKCNDSAITLCSFQASFGVLGTKWVLYLHSLDFRELKILEFFWDFLGKQNLCSTLALIHIKMSNEPKITTNNGILVFFFICWDVFFYYYRRHLVVLGQGLSSDNPQVVLTFCSLNLMAPKFTCLNLHKVVYQVS